MKIGKKREVEVPDFKHSIIWSKQ